MAEHLRLVGEHLVAIVAPPHGADAASDVAVVVLERARRGHLEALHQDLVRQVLIGVAEVLGQARAQAVAVERGGERGGRRR